MPTRTTIAGNGKDEISCFPARWKINRHGGAPSLPRIRGESLLEMQLAGLSRFRSGNRDTASSRVLIVTNHMDASLEIGLLHPFSDAEKETYLCVCDESGLRLTGDAGVDQLFTLLAPDYVIFCRYWGRHGTRIIQKCRHYGVPVLAFMDDNLLEVPEDAGQSIHSHFKQPEVRASLMENISAADLLVVSTPLLAERLGKYRDGKPLFATRISRSVRHDEIPASFPSLSPPASDPVVGYMATATHSRDLEIVVPALSSLMKRNPRLRLEFFGTIAVPEQLAVFSARIYSHPKTFSYDEFLRRLMTIKWDVGIAPLRNTTFNASKTPTKWVEYALAGIPMLTTPGPVYAIPLENSACLAAKPRKFEMALEELLNDMPLRQSILHNATKLLGSQYLRSAHRLEWTAALRVSSDIVNGRANP